MRQPHPSTHLVEALIKKIGTRQPVSIISARFQNDYPEADKPSDRTIASIKKRMEAPEAPPSNLCKDCKGYGSIYEETVSYFGDGTILHTAENTYREVVCSTCEGNGIDPNWEKPVSLFAPKRIDGSPERETAFVASLAGAGVTFLPGVPDVPEPDGYDESLEREL